jgi:hypothetical protein
MSDRAKVDVDGVKYSAKLGKEYMPVTQDNGAARLDTIQLMDDYKGQLTDTMSATGTTILVVWKSFLKDLAGGLNLMTLTPEAEALLTESNIATATSSVPNLYRFLESLKLDFTEVLHKSGITHGVLLAKSSGGYATLRPAFIQIHSIMTGTDENAKNFLVDMSRKMFHQYMDDIGYTISKESYNVMNERFKLRGASTAAKIKDARNMLLDGYFFHAGTMEQQLIQLESGDIFNFSNKAPKTILQGSLFEQFIGMDMSMDTDITTTMLGAAATTVLPNGKTLQDTTYEEME